MSQEMPDMFDRLSAQVTEWQASGVEMPDDFSLSSDRVLTATDSRERVEVTVKDFELASIRVDDGWYGQSMPSLQEIEAVIREAANIGLRRYWAEELEWAKQHRTPMGEIAEGLQELSVDFRAAYETAVERLERYS